MKTYGFVRNKPVARFFYKGDHTHPVRRTVIIVESSDTILTGYELREGSTVRKFSEAPIKSFRRDRIAKVKQVDRRRVIRKQAASLQKSTLIRDNLSTLITNGA